MCLCVCVTLELRACAGAARARAGRVRVGGVDAAPGTGDECAGWCETAGERDATALVGEAIAIGTESCETETPSRIPIPVPAV